MSVCLSVANASVLPALVLPDQGGQAEISILIFSGADGPAGVGAAECRRWRGAPKPVEGQTLQWVKASQLSRFAMPAADVPLLPAVRGALMALEASQPVRRPTWIASQLRASG